MDPNENFFQSPGFASKAIETPDASTPRTIGILNIIFASVLLLCGGCGTFYTVVFAFMGPMMQAQQAQVREKMEENQQKRIEQLDARIDEEQDEAARAELEEQRDRIAGQPAEVPDFSNMYGLGDPLVLGYYLTDLISGLVLNLAMLIAGIGLVGVREWGRRFGIWVARLKLLRLVVLYGVYLALVLPVQAEQTQRWFRDVAEQGGAGQMEAEGMQQAMQGMSYTFAGWAIATMVLGCIYPAITWLLLRRESVRRACTQSDDVQYMY